MAKINVRNATTGCGKQELSNGLGLTLQAKVVYIVIVLLLVPVVLATASWHLATIHPGTKEPPPNASIASESLRHVFMTDGVIRVYG